MGTHPENAPINKTNYMKVYLDNAATTPIDPSVLQVMHEVMESTYGNPSSIHAHGREARSLIERARKKIANLLNTSPSELFFTSGGTEAHNAALWGSIAAYKPEQVITSPIEHHAVLHTLEALKGEGMIRLRYVQVDGQGRVDLDHLGQLLQLHDKGKSLVSLMHANNEIGTLLDLEATAAICREHEALFHCDTVQTVGHYPHDLERSGMHFMACAAHKLHGPKGVGFLYVNHRVRIPAFLHGGAQERNMRGGTENVYGIVGMAKALEIAVLNMEEHRKHIQGLKSYLIGRLQETIPGVRFNGPLEPEESLYTVLNVSFPPTEMAEMLLFNLDINGISASGGSACSSGSNIGSHVLTAIGADPDRPAVRFSFSKFTTREEIDYTVEKLGEFAFQCNFNKI